MHVFRPKKYAVARSCYHCVEMDKGKSALPLFTMAKVKYASVIFTLNLRKLLLTEPSFLFDFIHSKQVNVTNIS